MKVDLSDGFYRIGVSPYDVPKLGVVFPTLPGQEPVVVLPLVLPMGWENSPLIFSTATETIADLANDAIHHAHQQNTTISHPLDTLVSLQDETRPSQQQQDIHIPRDPSLTSGKKPATNVDVFVDDFIGLAQGQRNRQRVRALLMQAIDLVFRPLHPRDNVSRREPISIMSYLRVIAHSKQSKSYWDGSSTPSIKPSVCQNIESSDWPKYWRQYQPPKNEPALKSGIES